MSNQYKAVAAVLQSAITSISSIFTSAEDEMHKIRITNRLQQEADQLLLLTGSGDLEAGKSAVLGPATTIGGKPIGKVRKFTADDMIPSDDKVNKLKKEVESAISYFGPEANAAGILANIPELIIRGVAKKAGLKVTKDEPKEITVEFIEEVKAALLAAGLTQPGELAIELTELEKQYLAEKDAPLILTDKPEGLIEVPDPLIPETKSTTADTIPPVNEMKAAENEVADFESRRADLGFPEDKTEKAEPKQESKPKETDTKKKTGK